MLLSQSLRFFLWVLVSAADAAAFNPEGIKTFLAYYMSIFFINDNLIFNNWPRSLPRNRLRCTILDSWLFDDFILADELFAKTLESFETSNQVIIVYAEN